MITISLCMIVRNEEEGLHRCLESVREVADELVIVDTGSTDRTKEIAEGFGAHLFDFEWVDDFGAARNFSFSKATQQFIMWLDADDVIEEKDRELLLELKRTLPEGIDRVTMPYNLAFDASGKPTSTLRRNRIVRRERNFQWIGAVHEYLAASGPVIDAEAAVTHRKNKVYTDRNLRIYLAMQEKGAEFSPRDLYYFANELRDRSRHEEAAEYYTRFLETGQGWIEDNIAACMKLSECYSHLGLKEKALVSLCRALHYDTPRAEFCCAMGTHWMESANYDRAIYWYKQAASLSEQEGNMALVNHALSTWYPHLQLCLCYDRLGQYEKAYEHNELALAFSPDHPSMLYNRNYFSQQHGLS